MYTVSYKVFGKWWFDKEFADYTSAKKFFHFIRKSHKVTQAKLEVPANA